MIREVVHNVVEFKHEFKWSPHPLGDKGFTQQVNTIIRDHNEKIQFQSAKTISYSAETLPDGLSRKLASVISRKTNSIYQ